MAGLSPPTRVLDYDKARRSMDWESERRRLDGLPGGGLNIAYEAIDRHVVHGDGDRIAMIWIPRRGEPVELSYDMLRRRTNRFANVLERLGHARGTRVASLAGRIPDLYVAAFGTFKAGGVYTPLFSAFGPEPIRQRIEIGSIEVLVTTARLFTRKVEPILDDLGSLTHILITGEEDVRTNDPRVMALEPLLAKADEDLVIAHTQAGTPALLHFTSGTTGKPKGVVHVHEAVLGHHMTGGFVLDLRPGDVFWCTADPGWVTGTSYGMISPMTHGVTSIIDEAEFDAARWYSLIEAHRVNIWYTAPTAIRMMMKVGREQVSQHDLTSLRLVASVGEPLNPEVVRWAQEAFRRPVLDNWWQTETGSIMIANHHSLPVKPGSMGRPLPGIDATILQRDGAGKVAIGPDGHAIEVTEPGIPGELAIRAGWPSMFRSYLNQKQRYHDCFIDGWYCSGDMAKRDEDGYFWFVGRGDDVIKSAGHLIGPFEVESALVEHPAVVEAAVIGIPHETMGNTVKAFVTIGSDHTNDDELLSDLKAHARRLLGPAIAPRAIEVSQDLPHTKSGKIMRRLLRARELGLDEGDLSTLETTATATVES